MEVGIGRRVAPCMVRHLRLGRETGDTPTSDVSRRCEGGGWMFERPPVLTFEVAVTSIVESNRVKIDYAVAVVG